MACSSCGGNSGRSTGADTRVYVVTFADGRTKEVVSEHAAKVEKTIHPTASYALK